MLVAGGHNFTLVLVYIESSTRGFWGIGFVN